MCCTNQCKGYRGIEAEEVEVAVDEKKLANLIERRKVYGDITQNATEQELKDLLCLHGNNVPIVIGILHQRVKQKGSRLYIPPAFYERDGTFYQPPCFEMKMY